jgi:hypothetical protein
MSSEERTERDYGGNSSISSSISWSSVLAGRPSSIVRISVMSSELSKYPLSCQNVTNIKWRRLTGCHMKMSAFGADSMIDVWAKGL